MIPACRVMVSEPPGVQAPSGSLHLRLLLVEQKRRIERYGLVKVIRLTETEPEHARLVARREGVSTAMNFLRGLPVKRNSYHEFVRWLQSYRKKRSRQSYSVSMLVKDSASPTDSCFPFFVLRPNFALTGDGSYHTRRASFARSNPCYEFRTSFGTWSRPFCPVLTFIRRGSPKKKVQHGRKWNSQGVPLLRRQTLRFGNC